MASFRIFNAILLFSFSLARISLIWSVVCVAGVILGSPWFVSGAVLFIWEQGL